MRRNRRLKTHIDLILVEMQEDVFAAKLNTHKLSGALTGVWACSCGYGCRIIFDIRVNHSSGDEESVLLDIDAHDEVY